jgi:hypothetical protein
MESPMEYDPQKVLEYKKRNLTVFENIHQIKIELSKGCNRVCDFCGISKSHRGLMSMETFSKIYEDLTPSMKRVEFILHGEPTLNKNIYIYSKMVREKLPKSSITILSNTEIFGKVGFDKFLELYDSGVNQIQADLYEEKHALWFLNQVEIHKKDFEDRNIKIYDYYEDRINPFGFHGGNKKLLVLTKEYGGLNNKYICTRDFHNFGGNLPVEKWKDYSDLKLEDLPKLKVCGEPLKYISIWYNGDITLCCRDGGMGIKIDNVHEKNRTLTEIWRDKEFMILRFILMSGRRDMVLPCVLCNIRSFRPGIYPYWGKEYSKEECLEELKKMHRLFKEEPLYDNLLQFSKIKTLEPHIQKLLEEA